MMSTEQVNKYLVEHGLAVESNTEDESQKANVEESKVEETTTVASNDDSNSEQNNEPKPSDQNVEETKVEDTKPVEETKVESQEDNKEQPIEKPEVKKEYTHQEKVDYAFQKEKAKRKKLEARIRELEEQNRELSEQNPNDFKDDNNKLIDYYVNKRTNEAEEKRLREEYQNSYNDEFAQLNEIRIQNCFPTDEERTKYKQLCQNYGPRFIKQLDEDDPENAVLSYLDDSDIAPLLTRILMTSDKYYNEVMSKRSPYGKYNALDRLAQKVEMAREQMAKEKQNPAPAPQPVAPVENKVKPSIPVIGSVTKSESEGNSEKVVDYNALLHSLNQRRGYGVKA